MDTKNRITIKDWNQDDQPREKLLKKGIEALSDAELIAILIGSGSKEMSAVDLSKAILNSAGNNLNELGKYDINELQKHKGIGQAKAITIIAALELGRRRKTSEVIKKKVIYSSKDVFEIFGNMLGDLPYEEVWILLLNISNKIIWKQKISSGGVESTITDIRLIAKISIEKLASSVIVCHNHPSGNVKPSSEDKILTEKIKNTLKIFEITLFDHIIVTDSGYYSFADEGII